MMEQKMSCERFMGQLDAYLDGALTAEEMRQMEAHADECAKCAEELNAGRQLVQMLRGLDDEIVVPLDVQAGWASRRQKRDFGEEEEELVSRAWNRRRRAGRDDRKHVRDARNRYGRVFQRAEPERNVWEYIRCGGAPVERRIAAKQGDRAKVMLVSAADAGAPVVFETDGEEQQKKVSDVVLEDEGAMAAGRLQPRRTRTRLSRSSCRRCRLRPRRRRSRRLRCWCTARTAKRKRRISIRSAKR